MTQRQTRAALLLAALGMGMAVGSSARTFSESQFVSFGLRLEREGTTTTAVADWTAADTTGTQRRAGTTSLLPLLSAAERTQLRACFDLAVSKVKTEEAIP